jgi:hypothetical protein
LVVFRGGLFPIFLERLQGGSFGVVNPLAWMLRSILLLVATTAWLQCVTVTRSSEDGSIFFLATYKGILHPRISQDFVHGGTLARIQFQHAANDMSRLTRQ